jgi:hypothetical protein
VSIPEKDDFGRTFPWVQSATMDGAQRWDEETVEDALDVLEDVVLWELTPQRWERVVTILDDIGAAVSAGHPDDLRAAVADLELSGPTRAFRIGSTEVSGISPPILERRNRLVHSLADRRTPVQPPAPAESDADVRPDH